jgi:hypothetical protein
MGEVCGHCGQPHKGNGNVVADLVACRNKLLADLNALRESLDPKWDATEAASDAWWRGHDDAARRCREVRDRLVAENERLRERVAELQAAIDRGGLAEGDCPDCEGIGEVIKDIDYVKYVPCSACGGSGKRD